MKLKSLSIQNFMSVRKAEIELADQGLILIQGKNNDDPAFDSNGAGKSTIFEALTWVMFDKTVRGLSGDEVVNRNIGKNTNVILDFVDDHGSEYRISRYRKHNEHKNNCYIFKNGKNITPKSTKDATKMIEEIFGMDFLTFTNSILFGQGLVKLFSIATDKEKKEILEKMLQIDEFKKLLEVTKARLSSKKTALSELSAERAKTENLIEEIKGTIASLEKAEIEENERVEAEIQGLKEELKEAKRELQEHIENSTDHSERLAELEQLKDKLDEKLNAFKKYEQTKISLMGDESSYEKQLLRLDKEIKSLKAEMEKIAAGQGTNCPACGQEITQETVEQALRHVAVKMSEVKKEAKDVTEKLMEVRADLETINKALEGKDKVTKQKDLILGEISQINASIKAEANLRRTYEQRVESIESSIEKLEKKLGTTYKPLIEEKSKQLVELEQQLTESESQKEKLNTEIRHLEFWVEAFGNSGIKSYLLDSVTPFLNRKANEYLSKLAGSTTTVEFSTQTRLASGELRDKFEVRILNTVGGDSYEANSTGERRRIDLAISLALQDLVMSRSNGRLNVLLYDEIFDGLDAIGCENAIQLLQEMQKNVESIFVITHNDILKSYFDRFLVVTKEDGATRVHKE